MNIGVKVANWVIYGPKTQAQGEPINDGETEGLFSARAAYSIQSIDSPAICKLTQGQNDFKEGPFHCEPIFLIMILLAQTYAKRIWPIL